MRTGTLVALSSGAAAIGMFILGVTVGRTKAEASKPAPSAPPSASVGSGSGGYAAAAAPRIPSGTGEPEPAPDASSPPAKTTWDVVSPDDSHGTWLVGRWVSNEHGDAIPGGPLGGQIVSGGLRAVFVRARPGSKTPWNVTFWAPTAGHMDSKTISGGCGFYPSGIAFCQGYGLPPSSKSHETRIALMLTDENPPKLQFVITDLLSSGALTRVHP